MALANTRSKRRWPAAFAAGVILAATFAVVAVPGSAVAADHRGGGGHRGGGDHRGGGRRDGGWGGGYYAPPPVVYGTPYYAAPPVIFGLPGLNINIR